MLLLKAWFVGICAVCLIADGWRNPVGFPIWLRGLMFVAGLVLLSCACIQLIALVTA